MSTPVEILERIGARVDALPQVDAEAVIALALRLQRIVKEGGSHGVLALSLCSASITAGLQIESERIIVQ